MVSIQFQILPPFPDLSRLVEALISPQFLLAVIIITAIVAIVFVAVVGMLLRTAMLMFGRALTGIDRGAEALRQFGACGFHRVSSAPRR